MFIPPKHRNSSVDTYCRLVEQDITKLLGRKREYKINHNLTKIQHMELETLRKDESLVVRSADKGGACLIMDRDAYDREILGQLADTKFYRKLPKNPTTELTTKVHACLYDLKEKGQITNDELNYMVVKSPIKPVFYTVPKYHKPFEVIPKG